MKVVLPNTLSSDYEGFSFLAKLNSQLEELMFKKIELGFENNDWFEANPIPLPLALISWLR